MKFENNQNGNGHHQNGKSQSELAVSHSAKAGILIVGSGVVGEATGKGFARRGHAVWYVDVNPRRIDALRRQGLEAMTIAQVNWENVDIVMLTVSTPTIDGKINLDYIESAAADVGRGLRNTHKFITVVVRSTVPPTTTEKRIAPILAETSGKNLGVDFGIAMNPEFLRQKTAISDFDRPWITVIGANDPQTADILTTLYRPFGGLISHCSPTEAEMIKYVNNIYNAVKISYFNEVHKICELLGIDSNLVGATVARSAESMWNPLYGIRGGVPYGGACLPKDTTAFIAFCQENGVEHRILDATIAANEALKASVPAAAAPDEIGAILDGIAEGNGKASSLKSAKNEGPVFDELILDRAMESSRTNGDHRPSV